MSASRVPADVPRVPDTLFGSVHWFDFYGALCRCVYSFIALQFINSSTRLSNQPSPTILGFWGIAESGNTLNSKLWKFLAIMGN